MRVTQKSFCKENNLCQNILWQGLLVLKVDFWVTLLQVYRYLLHKFSVLTTLSVIEPAPARVKSSSKLGFCSLTRGFPFKAYFASLILPQQSIIHYTTLRRSVR